MQDEVSCFITYPTRRLRRFLTDYGSHPEAEARGRVATLAQTFGIKEFQFYDWFATYSKPTNGSSWPDPFMGERRIYLKTILTYIDEIHRQGGAPGPTFRQSAPRRRISLTGVPGSTS